VTVPRLLLLAALATVPVVLVAQIAPSQPVLLVLLWVVAVALLVGVVWERLGRPHAELLDELEVSDGEPLARVRELKERLAERERECDDLSRLVENLSAGLGEGLLMVDRGLHLRLVNPVALHFAGVESVRPGTHLLDVVRVPSVVEAVRAAAAGGHSERVVVENPRGLWEVRAFPAPDGGAVALLAEVGLVRRSAEFRRRFVQDLSHELRSPLAVLRTSVEAMEGELDPRVAEIVVRQVERLTRLTDELYELASIEAGQVELKPELHRLAGTAREVVADFTATAERAGVELRVDVPDELYLTCDRRALERVLSNLVDNAVKYNRRGGWVELRGWAAGSAVLLRVSDSGVGIPATELKAVLQRFYRLDRARTPGEGGLGLGLAIVKHMVQHMGGTLQLDSREGLGTEVTLTFPTRPGIAAVEASPEPGRLGEPS